MKVLMINKFLFKNGGSESYVFRLGNYLKKQGHSVQYFGMDHTDRCVGNRVNAYTQYMDFHKNRGIFSKFFYAIKTIYSTEARRQIRKVLEDFQPDVCHLNNFNYQLTPSIILEIIKWKRKTGRNCRIIYTAHDYQLLCPNHMMNDPKTHLNCKKCLSKSYFHCVKGKCIHGSMLKSCIGALEAYLWRSLNVYNHIDRIICCSDFLKKNMDRDPLFASKTVTIHNFVDQVPDINSEKKDYVLYFGRFSEEKGVNTLIEACRELPDINFIFAGSGPLEEKVNSVHNIDNRGFQSCDNLKSLISEARFSICPSEWYENCPFSVIESQMYETPVLGADIGGIPELIKDGFSGLLFRSGDKADLKNKINLLWNDKTKCNELSENCKKLTFESIDSYYQKLIKIYKGDMIV